MSYLIKITGTDEDTRQEVSSHIGCATNEDYNDLLRRLNNLLNVWIDEKYPGIMRYNQIGIESTPGTLVSKKEASDGE